MKSAAGLDAEFALFTLQLGLDAASLTPPHLGMQERLNAVLSTLRAKACPALLIFDTYEQGGSVAEWIKEHALVAVARTPSLRMIITGQQVPEPAGSGWGRSAAPIIDLERLSWEPWLEFAKRFKPAAATEGFVRQVHELARNRPSLLWQLLGPAS